VRITQPHSERGLALLLVVSLLALVTLLVVSLAVITRVETQLSSTVVARAQARANALFALEVAVGQLQRYLGPDTKVTALSESLTGFSPGYANNPRWVGVWASDDNEVTPKTWLVSGNENLEGQDIAFQPTVSLGREDLPNTANIATLLGSGSTLNTGAVAAPKVQIFSSSEQSEIEKGNTVGRYAWWASDESVKLRINISDDAGKLEELLQEDEIQVIKQSGSNSVNADAAIESLTATQVELSEVLDFAMLPTVDSSANFAAAYHDITTVSQGVLSSTRIGPSNGLRYDLSLAAGPVGEKLARYLNYTDYMEEESSYRHTRRYKIHSSQDGNSEGAVIDHVAPILTDLAIGVYIFAPEEKVEELTVRFQFFAELWNPYTSELSMKALRIRLRGLPSITIQCSNGDTLPNISLEDLLGGAPEFDLTVIDNDLFRFLPGRVQNWTGFGTKISGRWQATPNSRGARNGQLELEAAVILPSEVSNKDDTLEVTTASTVTLVAELIDPETNLVLSRATSPQFDPLAKAPYPHDKVSKARISYRFRLVDRVDYLLADDPGVWFSEVDPRSPNLASDRFETYESQPGMVSSSDVLRLSGPAGSFFDRSASERAGSTSLEIKNDVSLYELPRQPLASLGSLQHVGFAGKRPLAIGNTWMEESGIGYDLFDNYYFSGLDFSPSSLLESLPRFRNLRLRRYTPSGEPSPNLGSFRTATDGRSSRFAMIEGPLNVNSTSVAVWAGLLGSGDLPDWQSVNIGEEWGAQQQAPGAKVESNPLSNAWFRFAQSAAETYEVETDLRFFDVQERSFYRRGVVEANSSERNQLAEALTELIRDRISSRGPFRSIGEFVEEGLVDRAISVVAESSGSDLRNSSRLELPDTVDPRLDGLSPSYLTQADVLTSLAPALSARGDTFIVRAYGEFTNSVTGEAFSEKWVEAIVQRVPDFINPVDPPETVQNSLSATNQRFGRRFKILSYRWLQPDQI